MKIIFNCPQCHRKLSGWTQDEKGWDIDWIHCKCGKVWEVKHLKNVTRRLKNG